PSGSTLFPYTTLFRSHLTYCTNIHPGESWKDTFDNLQYHIPKIKKELSPDQPLGIGLRLSNEASLDLIKTDKLREFKAWLTDNQDRKSTRLNSSHVNI